jgi:Beta-lactamase enzyme family
LTARLSIGLAAISLVGAAPASTATRAWHAHIRAATSYAATRAGGISFGVRTDRGLRGIGLRRTVPSASVLKPMLLVTYLRRPEVRHRALSARERALLGPMIRRSDNAAASEMFTMVGGGGLMRLARRVHMSDFRPASPPSPWGLSSIDVADQTRFFLHIERYIPARHRRYALRLLASIVPSQRWGIGRVRPRGWALYFKGGWGSGTGWVDHQVALLRRGGRRLAVAILVTSSPSHEYGKETLRGVAARLLRGLRPDSEPR